MKNVLSLSMILMSLPLMAKNTAYRPLICKNIVTGPKVVSDDYVYCINDNFAEIEVELEYSFSLKVCKNSGNSVNYFFKRCINKNFSSVARELGGIYLPTCTNASKGKLSFSFVSCVNQNNQRISNAL